MIREIAMILFKSFGTVLTETFFCFSVNLMRKEHFWAVSLGSLRGGQESFWDYRTRVGKLLL